MTMTDINEFIKLPESVRIPYFGGVWYRSLSRMDMKRIVKAQIRDYPLNHETRDKKIIVSLTSFPARIEVVQYAIKSLMLQTFKPDRIILWLAEEQFPDHVLPAGLTALTQYGLEIIYCEDLRGHKRYYKLIPQQADNELIVTYDDDIIFPARSLERLIRTHEKFPDCVVCNRGQALIYNPDGTVKCPGRWKVISNEGLTSPSYKILPSPGGGCLYPPGSLHPDACSPDKIKEYAYGIDDLWLMFMILQNGTKIVKTVKYHRIFSPIENSQEIQAGRDNIFAGVYDATFEKLSKVYKRAYENLTAKQA